VLGACYWLQCFGSSCRAKRVQLELDSSPATQALEKAFSATPHMQIGVDAARALCAEHFICARFRFVRGIIYNQLADLLSHNRWDEASECALEQFGLRLQHFDGLLSPIISFLPSTPDSPAVFKRL
jgi:hypothetical protein